MSLILIILLILILLGYIPVRRSYGRRGDILWLILIILLIYLLLR